MHLVVYFCGTGDTGIPFLNGRLIAGPDGVNRSYLDTPGIKMLTVKGCEQPEVCNSALFPDLKKFAKRFVNGIFKSEEHGLVADTNDGSAVGVKEGVGISSELNSESIESITLCGYSRGAVTCFEIARELKKIAPQIPVDIVADQPVPGNCYQGPGTNAASIADCSDLTNLRNVSVILGAYTGTLYDGSRQEPGNEIITNPIHRGFFSQIVPKLPSTANRDLIVIPRESHHDVNHNSPGVGEHMHMQMARYLNQQELVSDAVVEAKTEAARGTYTQHFSQNNRPALFPQVGKLQRFFGLSREEAYRHLDKLHPMANLRLGYTLGKDETLTDWWNKHDKNASRFSTQLTKDLVHTIEETDMNDAESLKNLFAAADKWLIAKADQPSSRYYQVESLRNNIHYRLTHDMGVKEPDLALINRQNLKEGNYFLNHWTLVSKEASMFKTDATRDLDKAFSAHAKAPQSRENDQKLMEALDTWLAIKEGSSTKRWDDVISIKEHLTGVINSYPQTFTKEKFQSIKNAPPEEDTPDEQVTAQPN